MYSQKLVSKNFKKLTSQEKYDQGLAYLKTSEEKRDVSESDHAKGLQLIKEAADEGYLKASYQVYLHLRKEDPTPDNLQKARHYLMQTIKYKRPHALEDARWFFATAPTSFDKAWCYANGIGVVRDFAQAFLCYQDAYQEKNPNAALALAHHFMYIAVDKRKAFEWLLIAAKTDNRDAKIELVNFYSRKQGLAIATPEERKEVCRMTSQQERAFNDELKTKDKRFVFTFAPKDAFTPLPEYRLGQFFETLKVKKDDPLDWYESAANLGHTRSQIIVGNYYKKRNPLESLKWYSLAAPHSLEAQIKRADIFFKQEEYKTAFLIYSAIARTNHAVAQFKLANCYMRGLGVKKDVIKAEELFQVAAQQGHMRAVVECKKLKKSKESVTALEVKAPAVTPKFSSTDSETAFDEIIIKLSALKQEILEKKDWASSETKKFYKLRDGNVKELPLKAFIVVEELDEHVLGVNEPTFETLLACIRRIRANLSVTDVVVAAPTGTPGIFLKGTNCRFFKNKCEQLETLEQLAIRNLAERVAPALSI